MAKDPYKYFRIEASELLQGLGQGVIELEKAPPTKELVGRLLRLAHTLKGAARVVKLPGVADLAHTFEEVLAPYREGHIAVPRPEVNDLFRLLETMATRVSAIEPAAVAGAATDAGSTLIDTVRVEVGEVDGLLEGITETTVQVHALERECAELDVIQELLLRLGEQVHPRRGSGGGSPAHPSSLERAGALADEARAALEHVRRGIGSALGQVTSELGQVRDAASRLRLLPAASIFAALELAARDAAQSLGKQVVWSVSGGEQRLDGQVLATVRDALLHAVRNAVAHGVESAPIRAQAGKPAAGHLEVAVERRGRRVVFRCRDDGGGFDVDALRQLAVGRGVITSAEAGSLDTKDLFQLILQGGLTTTSSPTAVSGRAVGLDVVREAANRLRGEVSLATERGHGTTIEISVPVSLSSVTALLVVAGDVTASVPLDAVRATMRLAASDVAHTSAAACVPYEGRAIPFLDLREALGQPTSGPKSRSHWPIVVIESGGAMTAIGVDRLLRSTSVIMQRLAAHTEVDAMIAGVSLDAEGHPQLVLDPDGLIALAQTVATRHNEPARTPARPILVIDDSLTTRMLEQSILESAGYAVELATSAEEAIVKAAERVYSLFVVDVEMPGMDGFEFVSRTRKDPTLRDIPAILVTSRGSAQDRQRGRDAGARAYIVKGEFDQRHLLGTIRELVGPS